MGSINKPLPISLLLGHKTSNIKQTIFIDLNIGFQIKNIKHYDLEKNTSILKKLDNFKKKYNNSKSCISLYLIMDEFCLNQNKSVSSIETIKNIFNIRTAILDYIPQAKILESKTFIRNYVKVHLDGGYSLEQMQEQSLATNLEILEIYKDIKLSYTPNDFDRLSLHECYDLVKDFIGKIQNKLSGNPMVFLLCIADIYRCSCAKGILKIKAHSFDKNNAIHDIYQLQRFANMEAKCNNVNM